MLDEIKTIFPAEWHEQSGIQLTWPHAETDWAPYLSEAEKCFVNIAREVSLREKLLIVSPDIKTVFPKLNQCKMDNIVFAEMPTNDTWARDHGGISLVKGDKAIILDFKFNGWGLKFASNHDNMITQQLFNSKIFSRQTAYKNLLNFVLEGGAIESDGEGTLLTTTECLLSPNRNGQFSKVEIEKFLKDTFYVDRVLWVNHGFLVGDDTDSHIDTLARFCDSNTIAYVKCDDMNDVHYEALMQMEKEIMSFTNKDGKPYRLLPLPMADEVWFEDERLPASYANFLIINGAVLMPEYGTRKDALAMNVLQKAFPDREIIGINCNALIKQHGSLHCVTMQFPKGELV